jgi:hypothetical protein
MELKQAWGWLMAGVLAAGLNAAYHDGGAQWLHRVADRVVYQSEAVLALAQGRTDQFLSDAQMLAAEDQTQSCPLASAMAWFRTEFGRQQADFAHIESLSALQEAQLSRLKANRARIEAQVARLRFVAPAFNAIPTCPRAHMTIQQLPVLTIPASPSVHIDAPDDGSI